MTTDRRWLPAVAAMPAAALCLVASVAWAGANDPREPAAPAAAASPVAPAVRASDQAAPASRSAEQVLQRKIDRLRQRRVAAVAQARTLEKRVATDSSSSAGFVAADSGSASAPQQRPEPAQAPRPSAAADPAPAPNPAPAPEPNPAPPPVDSTTGASGG